MSDEIKSNQDAVIEPLWMTTEELSKLEIPDVEWLWHGFIGRGLTTLFSARPKLGKTTLTFDLLQCASQNIPFLGQSVNLKGKILLLSEEPISLILRRAHRLGLVGKNILVVEKRKIKKWSDALSQIRLAIERENIELIILDTLASFWGVEVENDAHDVISALQPIQEISQEKNVGLLLIHHLRKMQGQDGAAHRGSGALFAIADVAIELYKSTSGNTRRELKAQSRFEETVREVIAEQKDGSYSGLGSPEELQRSEISRKIIDLLSESEGMALGRDAIIERLNPKPSDTSVKEILANLSKEGRIVSEGKGTKGSQFRYRMKPSDKEGGITT